MAFRRARFEILKDVSADGIRSAPGLIEFNAIHSGDHLFCLQQEARGHALQRVSYAQLWNAVRNCAAELSGGIATVKPARLVGEMLEVTETVAIFLESGLGLFVHLMALMGLGVPVSFVTSTVVLMKSSKLTLPFPSRPSSCPPVLARPPLDISSGKPAQEFLSRPHGNGPACRKIRDMR